MGWDLSACVLGDESIFGTVVTSATATRQKWWTAMCQAICWDASGPSAGSREGRQA